MTLIPETHRDLLDAQVAALATIGGDGYPQVTGVWFLLDEDGEIKVSLNETRRKLKNLLERPACTLFILDPTNPYRYVEIRARAEVVPDTNQAVAKRVGAKYGADLAERDGPGESRYAVTLHPVHVHTYG
jgi:PPOX class probable F420-dependent enzyme